MAGTGASRELGLALAAVLLLPGAAAKQSRKARPEVPPVLAFQGTLVEARTLAAERNVPLLVVAVYEDDAWDPAGHHDQVELIQALLADEELAPLLERVVVALGCNRVHEMETVEVGEGETRRSVRRCRSYHTDSCSVHQRLFEDAYGAWNTDGALVSPHVKLMLPDGQVAMQRVDGSSPGVRDLKAAIERAQKQAGPGLDATQHAEVLSLCAEGRDQAQRAHHGAAWRAWDAVLAITQNTGYADEARAGSAAALAGMEALRQKAREEVEAGRAVDGYALLFGLSQESVGTPIERDVAKELHALEMDKEHREEILAYKREREAEALLAEIEALEAAGDSRRAGAKLRNLLKHYEGTTAAAKARQRWPGGG